MNEHKTKVITDWRELGVTDAIANALEKNGFKHPTPIQTKTIPMIIGGGDLIGQAETGSGKTLACSIPAVQRVDPADKRIQVLILTPTRELAIQYLDEMAIVAEEVKLTPFAVYGGFDKGIQRAKFKEGVQLLVATPGRLIDLIYNDYLPLDGVQLLIVDEGDEMLDMGFIEDIEFIKQCLVHEHQTLLFSATMPPPIKRLAQRYMNDPQHVWLNVDQVTPQSLDHYFLRVSPRGRTEMLLKLLKTEKITQAIIFCNQRHRVSKLFEEIKREIKHSDFLHGGLDQDLRTRMMARFRKGQIRYIVTTDVMARGLDFNKVSHIIHYELHENVENYIHRSGRTARQGKKGLAIAFVTGREEGLYRDIQKRADMTPQPFKPEVYGDVKAKPSRHPSRPDHKGRKGSSGRGRGGPSRSGGRGGDSRGRGGSGAGRPGRSSGGNRGKRR